MWEVNFVIQCLTVSLYIIGIIKTHYVLNQTLLRGVLRAATVAARQQTTTKSSAVFLQSRSIGHDYGIGAREFFSSTEYGMKEYKGDDDDECLPSYAEAISNSPPLIAHESNVDFPPTYADAVPKYHPGKGSRSMNHN